MTVTARGLTGAGGGRCGWIDVPPEWRGTTRQVCGLWPFVVGSATPSVGVPLGRDLRSGTTVCCDPISWFTRAKLIATPSVWVMGDPGLGKSTLVRRMALGLAGYGHTPLILGDLKPDYVDLIEALGGEVVRLGRGQGQLNVLDGGVMAAAAASLQGERRRQLLAESEGRRAIMLATLLQVSRRGAVSDTEEAVLSTAIGVLDERHRCGEATIDDLLDVIGAGPEVLRRITAAGADTDRYHAATEQLVRSLAALRAGALGATFAGRSTVPITLRKPLCIDISGIGEADEQLCAAVLLACWGEGFGAIAAAQALTDAGVAPRRNFFVVLDELWRVLRAAPGLVDRVDALTRLNRQEGVGVAMITHSLDDLVALGSEAERAKARGLAARSGYVITGGLKAQELPALGGVVPLTGAEAAMLTAWAAPASWDVGARGAVGVAPGRGRFLVKVGGRPGIPIEVVLTAREQELNDTNRAWEMAR